MNGKDAVIYDDEVRVVPAPKRWQVLSVVGDTPFSVAEFASEDDANAFAQLIAEKSGRKVRHADGSVTGV